MGVDSPSALHSEFHTLTHARLRAAQGDVDGARAILVQMLERNLEPAAVRAMLRQLGQRRGPRGRIDRLEAWLHRVRRNARGGGD